MSSFDDSRESHALRGPDSPSALRQIRDVINSEEPLATAELDSNINPQTLSVHFDAGIDDEDAGRYDIRWSTKKDYNAHYTDTTHDYRFDHHAHEYPLPETDAHFHPPPNATTKDSAVEDSCFTHRLPKLFARSLLKCWRTALDADDFGVVNEYDDPP